MKRKIILAAWGLTNLVAGAAAQATQGINPEHLQVPGNSTTSMHVKNINLTTGVTLEYAEQGNTEGIPVILIHGFSDSWHSFEMNMRHFPASMHVFALTARGHGNSSKPMQGYHPADFSADIAAFMEQSDISGAVLVGHSMGSTIVQHFAVNYARLTKAIVLLGAIVDYSRPGFAEFKQEISRLATPVDSSFAAAFQMSTNSRPVPSIMMQKFIKETQKLPAYVWKGVAEGWDKSDFVIPLKNFEKPALILWGEQDIYTNRADQDLLRAALTASSFITYKRTGHALHWEEPVRFANDLAKFIGGLK